MEYPASAHRQLRPRLQKFGICSYSGIAGGCPPARDLCGDRVVALGITGWRPAGTNRVRDIAMVAGGSKTVPEETFGPFAPTVAADQPAYSACARELLGWQPTHPSLLEDLEKIQP